MKALIAFCPGQEPAVPLASTAALELDSARAAFGLADLPDPWFDARDARFDHRILVRVRAFALNFRDRAHILSIIAKRSRDAWAPIGSDFVGEVVSVGHRVTSLAVGQRVIGNSSYPEPPGPELRPGICTVEASRQFLILHEASAIGIPACMPDEVAAGFGVCAQTAWSMIRRIELRRDHRVLITAGTSNTSLFCMAAIRSHVNGYDAPITVSTASGRHRALEALGADNVTTMDELLQSRDTNAAVEFDRVFDPFADLYCHNAIRLLAMGGRYITCGRLGHARELTAHTSGVSAPSLVSLLLPVITKNIELLGNCLGNTADLCNAISDYVSGTVNVPIDSVFCDGQVADFIARTFTARERLGKVIYRY